MHTNLDPYDYVRDNKDYSDLVAKGQSILPDLESALDASPNDGLVAYMIAIAIEDITGTDIRTDFAVSWDTPNTFLDAWGSFVESVPDQIVTILDSDDTKSGKVEKLKKYGVLAIPTLDQNRSKVAEQNAIGQYFCNLVREHTKQNWKDSRNIDLEIAHNMVSKEFSSLYSYVYRN